MALTIEYDGRRYGFSAIYGTFPDWRRCIPARCEGAAHDESFFSQSVLKPLFDAGKALGFGPPSIMPDGRNPACAFYQDSSLFGVAMPMRQTNRRGESRPAWIDAVPPNEIAATWEGPHSRAAA